MGQVYEAIDEPSGRHVAIKTLRAELANDGEMLARFRNEARALMAVRHPGLVEVYETGGLPSGGAYIAMEFVDGQSLRRRLAGGLPPLSWALELAQKVAAALAAVHAAGIVHRDLKPENIMLLRRQSSGPHDGSEPEPDVKVIDFGIAKVTTNTQRQTQLATRTGVIMGTPLYMAPEQCGGEGQISDRTDVYALGCLLYELACGHPPFVGEADAQVIGKHLFQTPIPLRQASPAAPADLELLVHAMLAKSPEARPTMALTATALGQLQRGKPLSQTETKMLRLARDAATVRYRDAMTAQLGLASRRAPNTLLLAVLAALIVGLIAVFSFRRWDRSRPDPLPQKTPPPNASHESLPVVVPTAPPPPPRNQQPDSPSLPAPRPKPGPSKKGGSPRPAPLKASPPAAASPPTAPTSPKTPSPAPTKKPTKNTDIDLL